MAHYRTPEEIRRQNAKGPKGPRGQKGQPGTLTPAQSAFDPTGVPTVDEIVFPQLGAPGVGPAPVQPGAIAPSLIQAPPTPDPFPALTVGPAGLPTGAPAPLDRMMWAAQTGDWRNVAFAADTLRADDFEDGEGQKRLAQIQKMAQGAQGIVDVPTAGGRMADVLRPFLKRQPTAAPGGPPMPKLSRQIEQRLSVENTAELETQITAHESMSPSEYRSNEDFLYAHDEYLKNRKALETSQRAEQIMVMSKDPEKMAEIQEKMTVPGTDLENPARLSTEEFEAWELANEYDRELYRRGEPARFAKATRGLIEADKRAQAKTPAQKEEMRLWKENQQKLAAQQRKDQKTAKIAAQKAAEKVKLAKKLAKTPEGRKALIKAEAEKVAADRNFEVAKITNEINTFEQQNEKHTDAIALWRKRQLGWEGKIEKIDDKIDVARSKVDAEDNPITLAQVRKEHPGWFEDKIVLQNQITRIEDTVIPGLQKKIDANNTKAGALRVKVAAAEGGIQSPEAGGAVAEDDRFQQALAEAKKDGRTTADPSTFTPEQRQQITAALRAFEAKK